MPKTALITGASRGIGKALAEGFSDAGYQLAICCSNSYTELEALAEQLRKKNSTTILTFEGNVGEYSFVEQMVTTVLSELGSIDVLINNAGISQIGLLSDMSIEEWKHLMDVNLTSVFSTCRCTIPHMVHRKCGKIINISSVWGNVGASCEAAYSASKGAVNALTKALGKELALSNIQVNAIACGCIDTQMNACFSAEEKQALANEIPAGRFGTPEEVTQLALQLACASSYLTGQVITLDGGWC
jgi:3-oxoacyl-[acyl-carrier protein] reductase